MTYLTLSGVSASYGANLILDAVDLSISQGEMHVLLGPSGCGKTTLLRSIAGLVRPDRGTIKLAGKAIESLHPKDRGIGMVFQHYALFPNMTVRQNLAFGLQQRRLPQSEIDRKVEEALETVSLHDKADALPRQLSGGQKQRVALARALVLEPSLLLLDEPLSALDAQIRKRLRDELKRIQRRTGLTSILVTHDQDEALTLGDRISVLNQGHLVQTGTGADIFYRPADLFVARFIGDANIIAPTDFGELTGLVAPGSAVVQPHMFKLGMAPDADSFGFVGSVTDVAIAGSTVRYSMSIEGVAIAVQAETSADTQYLRPGDVTDLHLRRNLVHFI